MIARSVRVLLAAALMIAPVATSAQRMSDSYTFLKAVRDADGNKVTEILDKPGQQIINTRDRDSGEGALHIVAKRSDATYLNFLLSRGANINMQDSAGNTALLISVNANCDSCIDLLINRKANINLGNSSGETPLIRAVQLRNVDLADKLLKAGANPDQRDVIAGMSARDYAKADTRSPTLTKLLTDAAKVGGRSVSGPTLR